MTSSDAPETTAEEAPPAPGPDPALFGLPVFCLGSLALAFYLFGDVGAASIGFTLITVNGIGLIIAAIWAASLAASMVAGIFMIFGTFWISLGFTALGLANGWLGAEPDIAATFEAFLVPWLVLFVVLTLATFRLPIAFTGIFVFVDIAVALVWASVAVPSSAALLQSLAGIAVLIFAAIGLYLFAGSCMSATGGKGLSPGSPIAK